MHLVEKHDAAVALVVVVFERDSLPDAWDVMDRKSNHGDDDSDDGKALLEAVRDREKTLFLVLFLMKRKQK